MYETGLVRRACPPVGDDVLSGHRFAGGAMPLLPFLGAVGFAVGVQEQVVADRAAAVLAAEQAQGAGVERGCALAAPGGPVLGLGGVVGGRLTAEELVPDDGGPGGFG